MSTTMEWVLSIIIVAEPLILLIIMLMDRRENDRAENVYRPVYTQMTGGTQRMPAGNNWYLELIDVATGRAFRKFFRGSLICGRRTGYETTHDLQYGEILYLSNDQTISRQQCRLIEIPQGIGVENLSRANITLLNGTVLSNRIFILQQGDLLDCGNSRFLVSELKRCA